MKRLTALIIAMMLVLGIVACNNEDSGRGSSGDISDTARDMLRSIGDTGDEPSVPEEPSSPAEELVHQDEHASVNTGSNDILVYFDDTWANDWFPDDRAMFKGAEEAHRLTSVRFGIWVCNDVLENTNPSDNDLEVFADALYDVLFEDSAEHLLLVMIDLGNGAYAARHITGNAAGMMFCSEAMVYLYSRLDYYWGLPEQYTESEMFGLALSQTAEWIVSRTPAVPIVHKDTGMNIVTPLSEIDKFSVFWGHTGDRIHINPECSTFRNGVLFGSLEKARSSERYEWCGTCSSRYRGDDGYGGDAEFLRDGNPNIR